MQTTHSGTAPEEEAASLGLSFGGEGGGAGALGLSLGGGEGGDTGALGLGSW